MRADHMLNLRQCGRAAHADERGIRVEVVEAGLKLFDGARFCLDERKQWKECRVESAEDAV